MSFTYFIDERIRTLYNSAYMTYIVILSYEVLIVISNLV